MKEIGTKPVVAALAVLLVFLSGSLWSLEARAMQQDDLRSWRIEQALNQARTDLIAIRHDLHRHPELSGQERRTAGVVAERLRHLGLEVKTGIGGHGVVGTLYGSRPGAVVAYRADMDAVRSNAPDPAPFASQTPGVRHICGHDIHVTVALGIAEALAATQGDFPGTVKFIFQPAEENVQGAQAMIRDGVLRNPAPAAIFAVHSAPFEVGQVGAITGMGLPGLDRIVVQINGTGDTQATARAFAAAITGVSTVGPPGSANTDAGSSFIYSNARAERDLSSEGRWVVRGFVKASGEDRYAEAKHTITSRIAALKPDGVEYALDYQDRVLPDMINDGDLVRASLEPLHAVVGEAGVIRVNAAVPYFGEDFAFYQQQIPGALYWLGVSNTAKGLTGMPHSPGFAADDEAIMVGTRAMTAVLLHYLETHR